MTCASVSALSLDAQPAQFDKVVKRICRPLGEMSLMWFKPSICYQQGIEDFLSLADFYKAG
jgi:hypothetical protein